MGSRSWPSRPTGPMRRASTPACATMRRARSEEEAFSRFPTWMWRNAEVRDFADWMRVHNAALPPERRAEFRGLDVYSLNTSIKAVLGYLSEVDPQAAQTARSRYGCLSPW